MNRRSFLASLGVISASQKWQRYGLEPDQSITTARFPYVQNVRSDRATIMWATAEAGNGGVRYSDGVTTRTVSALSRLFSRTETGLLVNYTQYQTELTGLNSGTDYSYQPFVSGIDVAAGGDMRFRTPGSGPFNFLVLGDSGEGSENQFLISRLMFAERPALVLHTGDVVYPEGTYEQYQLNYFNYYYATMSSVPFFPTPGNHDYGRMGVSPYINLHSVPTESVPPVDRGRYYSFDWGNVHFVSLDAHFALERAVNSTGQMLKWLEMDLRSTRKFWRVVYFHYPPYAAGPNQNDLPSFWVRQYVVPILEAYGVQIVFSGHEHSFQRTQSIWKSQLMRPNMGTIYYTSGGGGALLYDVFADQKVAAGVRAHHYLRVEVRDTRMIVHAIRADGVEIDTFTVAPQPVLADADAVTILPSPAPGSLVRIVGRSLASDEVYCNGSQPLQMAGTSVSVNGRAIPLVYVSHNQIYALLPFRPQGNIIVRIANVNGVTETSLSLP